MADPVTLAGVGIASTIAGGAVSAFGAGKAGKAASDEYNYKAAIARMNKQVADQNADYAIASGEVKAQQSDMATRAKIGATKAIQGASGLDVNKGSAVDVRASEADIGAEDTAIVRNNAARTAYGYKVEAANATAQGNLYTKSASNSLEAGKINQISSILGTASSVSSKWLTASQYGVGSSPGWVGDSGHSGWIDNPDA